MKFLNNIHPLAATIIALVMFSIFFPSILNISKILKKFTAFFASTDSDKNAEISQEIVNDVQVNKNNLTYSQSEYEQMALAIFDACDGIGTDTDRIINILSKLRTVDDAKMLFVAYGVRDKQDLISRMRDELGFFDQACKKEIKSKFEGSGIDTTF